MYAIEFIKKEIKKNISKIIEIDEKNIEIRYGPYPIDFSVPLFKISKIKNIEIKELGEKLIQGIKSDYFDKIEEKNGYLNFYLNFSKFSQLVFLDFYKLGEKYGKDDVGKNKTIIIDYSSPNIAKPLSIQHLRSTIIGDSFYRIYNFLGYKVLRFNHIGDWGLQFGEIIYAYKNWLNKKSFNKNPILELLRLYIKFNRELEKNEEIKEKAKEIFSLLEKGDKKLMKIWKKIVNISLKEFKKIYNLLGIDFDYYLGESFYVKFAKKIIKDALDKGIAKYDEKEKIVFIDLSDYNLLPLIIQKSDESTLYATRDIAAAIYRLEKFKPEKIIYVVGSEQKLYFKQLFSALNLLGYKGNYIHADFGLIIFDGGKLSTRKGKIILLEDLINEAIKKAEKLINKKISRKERKKIAKIVGIGGIKFNELSQERIKDIKFDWEKILNLRGRSAPYIQYTYVRANSILKKAKKINKNKINPEFLNSDEEKNLIKLISYFPEIIKNSANSLEPYLIANYLFEISEAFNKFYENIPVLKSKKEKDTRLMLVKFFSIIIKNGLYLLGISVPEKM
ncbi:MAG: arginine--tRNA ligase [Candidatus Pacearchaeota archaeon]